ncbi:MULTISPECIES: hypothetical protein [unclassified Crossiella]|uniref:hypothetical protein n=1 Tax=unclassified Crossiella TaxID=2620835 RepID=UPI001FFEBC8A|nr:MULTISPECIES: hypothetical protein [unclassified Crossiella]MCK2240009.1 hypothetical protein [Crossiella sp. S99.2]MCK2252717.1 hypothetical protein [Crossiella sp. S99.1]
MNISAEVDRFLTAKEQFLGAMRRELRDEVPVSAITEQVASAFGRDQAMQYLAAVSVHDDALKALQENGLGAATRVHVTGIRAPGEATLTLERDTEGS